MIVLQGFVELDEVFGGSRSDQEGSMSTRCCTCQRFGASQEPITPQRLLQKCSKHAPGTLRGMPPEASRASSQFVV